MLAKAIAGFLQLSCDPRTPALPACMDVALLAGMDLSCGLLGFIAADFDRSVVSRSAAFGAAIEGWSWGGRAKRPELDSGYCFILFCGFVGNSGTGPSLRLVQVPGILTVVGNLLVAVGFLIVYLVFRVNSFTAGTIEVSCEQTVATTGPYAVIRHPMYAGALILLLGTPLALGSFWGLLALIPMTAALAARLLDEEKLLAAELPGYREYCRTVRFHLVPFVW